jgi:succinate-semialdehyde dehydrogenase/glutarate-semialdehyde dehydrogenase
MELNCTSLFEQAMYIGGRWVDSTALPRVSISNPATNEIIGSVPQVSTEMIDDAINCAAAAFQDWRGWSSRERAAVLRDWARLVQEHREDLAIILCSEQGKPLHEARAEIAQAANYLDWFGEESRRIYGDNIPAPRRSQRIRVLHQPVGVCGTITSWTFPSSMVARRVGAALAAGCTVIHYPDPKTPFSALALCALGETAGLPRGVLSVLTGEDASLIKSAMTSSVHLRKISFTGAIDDGKKLMAQCSSTVKKLSLELGANCPFVVFADADIDLAVKGALDARFRHSGQAAMCANRFFVHESVYEQFVSALASRVSALKVGNGMSEGVQVGPLICDAAVAHLEELVAEAVRLGATIATGGGRSLSRNFYQPTVLRDVKPHMKVCGDEILGPIASVLQFKDEDDVISLANNTSTGLAAYFYTSDISRAFRVMEALECGVVGINDSLVFNEVAPFGGIKESGMGREGAHSGIEEYLEAKYVCFGNV